MTYRRGVKAWLGSGIEDEITASLIETSHYEGTTCTFVPGMTSHFHQKQYEIMFGSPPKLGLHLTPKA